METLEADKDNLQNMDVNHVGIKDPRSDKNRFQICEVCGVFQAVDGAEDRIARHFEGKQHKGFDIIRQKIKELEALHTKEMNEIQEREERDRDRTRRHRRSRDTERRSDRSSSHHRSRRRERERERGRDRDRLRYKGSRD